MKQVIYILLIATTMSCHARWQQSATKGFEQPPNLHLLLLDSSTIMNINTLRCDSGLILFYFSPDCEYCQAETAYLLSNMRYIRGSRLLLVSNAPIRDIRSFVNAYHLEDYHNVTIANDFRYEFFNLYKVQSYPTIVIYNKARELAKLYIGEIEIDRITKAIQS